MIVSKDELLDLYEDCFDKQEQMSEINKVVTENLKGYAENNELSVKAVKAGYKAYKSYAKGSVSPSDEDYMAILTIVEESFDKA